jgi:hypothetical protein
MVKGIERGAAEHTNKKEGWLSTLTNRIKVIT